MRLNWSFVKMHLAELTVSLVALRPLRQFRHLRYVYVPYVACVGRKPRLRPKSHNVRRCEKLGLDFNRRPNFGLRLKS